MTIAGQNDGEPAERFGTVPYKVSGGGIRERDGDGVGEDISG